MKHRLLHTDKLPVIADVELCHVSEGRKTFKQRLIFHDVKQVSVYRSNSFSLFVIILSALHRCITAEATKRFDDLNEWKLTQENFFFCKKCIAVQ